MMTTARPPSDFAERLRRIEEKRSQTGRAPIREARTDLRFPNAGHPDGLRNTFIVLMITVGIGLAGFSAWKGAADTDTHSITATD